MKLFAQITKVDEAKRLVIGRAVQEMVDRADEVFDYVTSKPHFQSWSKAASADTDGKSLGNLRAMHGKVAAGKLTGIDFNDADKAIDIQAKVVDDNEWNKVLEGVYTGFSIGGSYIGERITEKVDGREVKRYTASPTEISLVDSPCIPSAKFFEVHKADGVDVKVPFKEKPIEVTGTDDEVAKFAKALNDNGLGMSDAIRLIQVDADAKLAKAEVDTMLESLEDLTKREFSADERKKSAESGHALPDGSFPIENVSDLENAIKAYGRAKDKAKAKSHIEARAKALGASDKLPEDWGKTVQAPVQKSELDLAFEEMLRIGTLHKRLNDPELPFVEFTEIAKANLTVEELTVCKTADDVKKAVLAKAKMSAANTDRVQAVHDHSVAMGADCDGDTDKSTPATLQKLDLVVTELDKVKTDLAKLQALPMPHPIQLRTITKVETTKKADAKADDDITVYGDKPITWFEKMADGVSIDWEASRKKLEQAGA
jgi:hypothetical protein